MRLEGNKSFFLLFLSAVLLTSGCLSLPPPSIINRSIDQFAEMTSADAALIKANTHEVIDGTISTGNDTNTTKYADVNYMVVNESGQFKIDLNYTGAIGTPATILFSGRYDGNPAHNVELKIWNFVTNQYDDVLATAKDFPSSSTDSIIFFTVPEIRTDYINETGETRLRIEHEAGAMGAHNFYLDTLSVIQATTDLIDVGVYHDVNGYQNSIENGIDANIETGIMTVSVGGNYRIAFYASFAGKAGTIFESALFVNGIEEDSCEFVRRIETASDVGSASFGCFLEFVAGDEFKVRAKDFDVNSFMALNTANFLAWRLG